jgi:hypothetical protein
MIKFLLKYLKSHLLIPKYYKDVNSVETEPIFILGGNRSGTSIITSIISSHPNIEGIFNDNKVPVLSKNKHVMAYCTSHHIWDFLIYFNKNWAQNNEGVLWGHPKNISKYYRDKPKNKRESLLMANSIEYFRKTNKQPLINSHFNMFRIGLIKKVFPKAKFVLIIKNYEELIKSCYDKWPKQGIKIEYPKIGLHWYNSNLSCIYDLKKYSPKDHCIIDYSLLFGDLSQTRNYLNKEMSKIGLNKFEYNLDLINQKYRFINSDGFHGLEYEKIFGCVDTLINYEEELIEKSIKKEKR